MKKNRKKIIISAFLLLDLVFCGVIFLGKNAKNATTSISNAQSSDKESIVESINTANEGMYNLIGAQVLSQEDLIMSQNIILEEQQQSVNQSSVVNAVAVTNNAGAKTATTTIAKKKANEQRIKEQQALINSKATSAKGSEIVKFAMQFNGNPYVMGGTDLIHGTDCSGFTQSVYKHFGIDLPRVARDQANVGVEVPIGNIQPGDLVFYSSGQDYVTHAAIYIGDGKIIHARTPKTGIGINSIFIMRRLSIRRVI